ncbi:hypothetical protein BV20DRAFT_556279 [Pilatotrama ljubarskyi]|nr:hypothetical protein BV20DRAFT_556279 [Pilatotrama ljubarskyi]
MGRLRRGREESLARRRPPSFLVTCLFRSYQPILGSHPTFLQSRRCIPPSRDASFPLTFSHHLCSARSVTFAPLMLPRRRRSSPSPVLRPSNSLTRHCINAIRLRSHLVA